MKGAELLVFLSGPIHKFKNRQHPLTNVCGKVGRGAYKWAGVTCRICLAKKLDDKRRRKNERDFQAPNVYESNS